MSKGAVRKRTRVREVEGVPGTVEPGYTPHPIVEQPLPEGVRRIMALNGVDASEMRVYSMGPCNIMVGHEPAGAGGEKLWHLTISTPSRHPTWDEIKTARYKLLPPELTFGMLLPPPEIYVNVPQQDHVFQLWEITDPRHPWMKG